MQYSYNETQVQSCVRQILAQQKVVSQSIDAAATSNLAHSGPLD